MTGKADELPDAEDNGSQSRGARTARSVMRRLLSTRRVFFISLAGFGIGAMLVPLIWSTHVSLFLALLVGMAIIFASDAGFWRRGAARLAWVSACGGVGVLTAAVAAGLPGPWQDFLIPATGMLAGNVAYAYVTSTSDHQRP